MQLFGRFICGAFVGAFVALLFNFKVGGNLERSWWLGIIFLFGLIAVVFWRWFSQIVNAALNPAQWG